MTTAPRSSSASALNARRAYFGAGRKVVHCRVALRVTGVRLRAAHDETLVALGSDIVADRAVASHAAGVRHEHARLAGDVGAEIPGMDGEREQSCVRGRVDVLAPLFRRFGRRLAAVDAVLAHMGDAVSNPLDVLLDRHGHVAKHRRASRARYGEEIRKARNLQPEIGSWPGGPAFAQRHAIAPADVDL